MKALKEDQELKFPLEQLLRSAPVSVVELSLQLRNAQLWATNNINPKEITRVED